MGEGAKRSGAEPRATTKLTYSLPTRPPRFAPKASLQPKLTTSNSMDTNVSQNPLGLAHSSMPLRQLQAGVLPQATLDMQAHLSREQPFKIMYIMAAVDCDVEEMKLGAKDKKEEHIYGGTKALGGPRFYEKVSE